MTNEQLYLAIGVPVIVNMLFNTLLFLSMNARITAGLQESRDTFRAELRAAVAELRAEMLQANHMLIGKIAELEARIDRR